MGSIASRPTRILSIESGPQGERLVRQALGGADCPAIELTRAADLDVARRALADGAFDVILLPLRPSGSSRSDALSLLHATLAAAREIPVLVLADADLGPAAVREGAAGYVGVGRGDGQCDAEPLLSAARSVIERERRARAERHPSGADAEHASWHWGLLEQSLDGILLTTPDGEVLFANPAICQMLGYTEEELRTRGRAGVVDLSDPRLPIALQERRRTGRFVGELTFIAKDGRRIPVELSSRVFVDAHGHHRTSMFVRDITARERAEAALRASEERLRRMVNIEGVAVLIFDAAGTLIDANDTFLRLTGHSRRAVEEKSLTWRTLTPPEYVEASEAQMRRLDETGRIGPYEKEYLLADGSRSWMLFAGASLGDGTIVEYCIDVSDRKRAEENLRRSEERFRIALQSSPITVSTVDRDLRYTWIYNPHWSLRAEDALGKRDDELAPAEHVAELVALKLEVLTNGRGVRREISIQVGGEHRFYDVTAEPERDPKGAVIGVILAAADITDHKRMEVLLQRLSTTDVLTGLLNRRGFIEFAHREAAVAHRGGRDLLVIYVDLDRFKQVNDTHGHTEGDRLLRQVAELLRHVFRASDVSARLTTGGEVFGRLGGDEFAVLALDTGPGAEDALRTRLAEAVREFNSRGDVPYALSLSVGVVRWSPDDPASLEEIMARADQRMYDDKEGRRTSRGA